MKQEQLNDQLRSFLIKCRKEAKLSQSEVAARSDIFGLGKTLDQRTVSRIEKQPLSVDAIKIAGYLSAVGVQPRKYYELLAEITQQEDSEIMSKIHSDDISLKISQAENRLDAAKQAISEFSHDYVNAINLTDRIEQLEGSLKTLNRKPVIGCFGHFDAGKSTLINTVINDPVLPTKYQPATCVVNVIMHVDDKPQTIHGSVALFRKGFSLHMIHSTELVEKYLIEQGETDILDRLGVHNHDEDIDNDAYIAIVFSNAEILRKVWLLDTPGDLNSSDESDTEKALGGVELADGIVFISNHTGFFKESDLGFATNILRQKPPADKSTPVSHILFVQSHCHSEIDPADVASVGKITFKRIKTQLDELIFQHWIEDGFVSTPPSPEELTSRVHPFWRENESYRTGTLKKISEIADFLTENHSSIVEKNIVDIFSQIDAAIRVAIESLEQKKHDSIKRIKEVEQKEARFRTQSSKLTNEFNTLINSCPTRKQSDLEAMRDYYKYNASQDGLEELICKTYSDKKEAQAEIGNYISQLLTSKLESTLKSSGKLISNEVDALLIKWQEAAPPINESKIDANTGDITIDASAFNSRAAFVGGLAGLGSLGAMALYVSTIASNLGAYILVGKAAGVLVSLGLAGSVTSVISFVSAIGGPITIGIALAAAVAYAVYRLFGGSWQKSLAKKVAEAIKKEDVLTKIEKSINQFWGSTQQAIKSGLDELISQTEIHIDKLKKDAATDYSHGELEKCIVFLAALRKSASQTSVG